MNNTRPYSDTLAISYGKIAALYNTLHLEFIEDNRQSSDMLEMLTHLGRALRIAQHHAYLRPPI